MKSFGIIHIFLILVFMLVYTCSHAQDYLVTTKGDTLRGEIKPLTYGADKKVQITGEDKKKNVFPLFQVKAYSLKNETFQPVKGPNGYTFMKLIKPGYLSLYTFQLENQVTYDGQFLLKKDGSGTEVPNLAFKKILKNFLSECPVVADNIDKGSYSKKDLNQIIDDYNACISSRTADHDKVVAQRIEQTKKMSSWDVLETKVKEKADFEGKSDALEMISEIKNKIARSEKVPNFVVEGLKSSLAKADLQTELDNALKELK